MFALEIMFGYFIGFFGFIFALWGVVSLMDDEKIAGTIGFVLSVLMIGYGFFVNPLMVKEKLTDEYREKVEEVQEEIAEKEANQKDVLRQVNRVLGVDDSLIIEGKKQGKYEVKSMGKLYSVHVDTETNELTYIVHNGEFVYEVEDAESEKIRGLRGL